MNEANPVIICESDYNRILSCLEKEKSDAVELLRDELDEATIVADTDLPGNVVNMGATVSFRDLENGALSQCTLVFPHLADVALRHVSILAPVGAALIGLAEGGTIAWPLPGGKIRRLEVISVAQHHRLTESA